MRLEIRITGKGSDVKTTYSMELMPAIPFGRDDPKTVQFITSLSASLQRGMALNNKESTAKGLLTEKDKQYIQHHHDIGDYARIFCDGWVENRKGRPVYFCRITNDENGCSVRTANILPIVTRYVWGITTILKKTDPPKGFECLKGINIIKKFFESQNAIGRIVVNKDESHVEFRKD